MIGAMTYCIAERDEMSLEGNHLQISIKRRLANTVKDGINAMSTRNLLDLAHNVVIRVDQVIRAVLLRQRQLLIRARRRNDLSPDALEHLHQQRANTTRRGMHQRPLPGLDLARLADKGPRRQALQEDRRGLLAGQLLRNGDHLGGVHGGVLGVGGGGGAGHVGHARARSKARDGGVSGDDFARGFTAHDQGHGGRGVQAGAEVCVDVVDAGEAVPDEHLARAESWHGDLGVLEDLWAANLGDLDGLHGCWDGSHFGG